MVSFRLSLPVALLALVGCAAPGAAPAQGTRETTLVALEKTCPTASKGWAEDTPTAEAAGVLAVLIAQIGGVFVEKLVDYGAAEIAKWKDMLSASSSARTRGAFYSLERSGDAYTAKPRYGCLVLVRGIVGDDSLIKPVAGATGAEKPYWTEKRLRFLAGLGNDQEAIPLVAAPKLYAEFAIQYDDNQQHDKHARHFALQAHFIDYAATAAERSGDGAKDLVFSFVFDRPKDDGTSATYAKFDLPFAKAAIGRRLDKTALKDKTTGWVALPSYGSADKRDWTPVPTNLLGTLAETEKAGDLELLIEQTARSDKTKQAVTKALNDMVQNLLTPKAPGATEKK